MIECFLLVKNSANIKTNGITKAALIRRAAPIQIIFIILSLEE